MSKNEILLTMNRKAADSPELWAGISFLQSQTNLLSITGERLEAATERARNCAHWVVVGGDGTLNHVLNNLMTLPRNDRPLICYIPYGTGNDFARTVGMDKSTADLLAEAFGDSASYPPVTVGKCNERYFLNMASGGIFATVTAEANQGFKNLAGRWAYFIHGIGKLLERDTFEMQREGSGPQNALGFFVANARYAGGGVQVLPHASPFTPSLEFLPVPDLPAKDLLSLGLELQKESPDLTRFPVQIESVKEICLSFAREIPINLDGEQIQVRRAKFSLEAEAVRIFVPRA